jgi:hypothetical protein
MRWSANEGRDVIIDRGIGFPPPEMANNEWGEDREINIASLIWGVRIIVCKDNRIHQDNHFINPNTTKTWYIRHTGPILQGHYQVIAPKYKNQNRNTLFNEWNVRNATEMIDNIIANAHPSWNKRGRKDSFHPDFNLERAAAILKVDGINASRSEIEKKYKKLALITHPDKNPHNRVNAKTAFEIIKAAKDRMIAMRGGRHTKNTKNTKNTKKLRRCRRYRKRNNNKKSRISRSSKPSK